MERLSEERYVAGLRKRIREQAAEIQRLTAKLEEAETALRGEARATQPYVDEIDRLRRAGEALADEMERQATISSGSVDGYKRAEQIRDALWPSGRPRAALSSPEPVREKP